MNTGVRVLHCYECDCILVDEAISIEMTLLHIADAGWSVDDKGNVYCLDCNPEKQAKKRFEVKMPYFGKMVTL